MYRFVSPSSCMAYASGATVERPPPRRRCHEISRRMLSTRPVLGIGVTLRRTPRPASS